MSDIFFRTPEYVFSCRTAGILIREGRVLLQKPDDDEGYAVPGGHVAFGETNAETLIREYREECGADIQVDALCAVAEIFFPWGDKPCHQFCTYFRVHLTAPDSLPYTDTFMTKEHLEGRIFPVRFYWIPLEKLGELLIYPPQIVPVIRDAALPVQHFIYRED
ncbi:MAG: NUDIX domain-containing protein [Clostridia bacterium]|nr:NUDIX domain-containing protein [Clostridia bacterium]